MLWSWIVQFILNKVFKEKTFFEIIIDKNLFYLLNYLLMRLTNLNKSISKLKYPWSKSNRGSILTQHSWIWFVINSLAISISMRMTTLMLSKKSKFKIWLNIITRCQFRWPYILIFLLKWINQNSFISI